VIGTRNGYWLIDQTNPSQTGGTMERDTSNHPGPHSGSVNLRGDDLTDAQLATLTPEQVTRLTSGEPLPVDPRSPLAPDDVRLDVEPARRSPVAEALDRVEGMGDGDGDGLMDHSSSSDEDRRETETGATTAEHIEARDEHAAAQSGTPVADSIGEPVAPDGPAPGFRRVQ
jgi:hypothetical protein